MTTLREDLLNILKNRPRSETFYLRNILRSPAASLGDTHEPYLIGTREVLAELRRMETDGVVKDVTPKGEHFTKWSLASA